MDLFEHNLKEMYFVERFLVDTLEKLQSVAASDKIRADLLEHKEETVMHIENLEEVFAILGIPPQEHPSHMWKDMDKELETFFKEFTTDEAADFFVLEAAMKAERLEITHYETLILLAKELDLEKENDILDLLRANLVQEERALEKVRNAMKAQLPLLRRNVH